MSEDLARTVFDLADEREELHKRIRHLEAEVEALRDQVQAVRDACNSSTETMSWRPPRGERGIHFPVVRVDRILATLDGDA